MAEFSKEECLEMQIEELNQTLADEREAYAQLEAAAQALVDLYIANKGSSGEFISCITPPHASSMTFFQRTKSQAWSTWDNLRMALGEIR